MRRVAGIDVGGTFTDLLIHEAGPDGASVRLAKVPTSAGNQAQGVLDALEAAGVSPATRRIRPSLEDCLCTNDTPEEQAP